MTAVLFNYLWYHLHPFVAVVDLTHRLQQIASLVGLFFNQEIWSLASSFRFLLPKTWVGVRSFKAACETTCFNLTHSQAFSWDWEWIVISKMSTLWRRHWSDGWKFNAVILKWIAEIKAPFQAQKILDSWQKPQTTYGHAVDRVWIGVANAWATFRQYSGLDVSKWDASQNKIISHPHRIVANKSPL